MPKWIKLVFDESYYRGQATLHGQPVKAVLDIAIRVIQG